MGIVVRDSVTGVFQVLNQLFCFFAGNNLNFYNSDGHFFLNNQPDIISGGKTSGISKITQPVIEILNDACNRHQPDKNLEKTQNWRPVFLAFRHHHNTNSANGYITNARQKNQEWKKPKSENIAVEKIMVITDDLNLSFGTIRLKTKGSDGGHNGLKDIQSTLNTTKYNRFRFGISNEFSKGQQVDYVLGEWGEEERKELPERFQKSSELVKSFGTAGVSNTMNSFNGK